MKPPNMQEFVTAIEAAPMVHRNHFDMYFKVLTSTPEFYLSEVAADLLNCGANVEGVVDALIATISDNNRRTIRRLKRAKEI